MLDHIESDDDLIKEDNERTPKINLLAKLNRSNMVFELGYRSSKVVK